MICFLLSYIQRGGMQMEKTMTVPGRVDIVSYATVVRGYAERGIHLKTKSDVIWQVVEDMAAFMERQGTERYAMVDAALDALTRAGLFMATNDRAKRSIARALQTDVLAEVDMQDYGTQRVTKKMLEGMEHDPFRDGDLDGMYDAACIAARTVGGEMPLSREEYKRKMAELRAGATGIIAGTEGAGARAGADADAGAEAGVQIEATEEIDVDAFALREKKKMEALKDAMRSAPMPAAEG
jgi:hypothetical protein